MKPSKEISLFDQVDFVKSFCYVGDRLNASGGSEVVVTAKTSGTSMGAGLAVVDHNT